MAVLVTGAAGFIGMHVVQALLARGEPVVIGIDDLAADHDPALKAARLRRIDEEPRFRFLRCDIAAGELPERLAAEMAGTEVITGVVHLGGRPGPRSPLARPASRAGRRLYGQLMVLELCRQWLPALRHLVYASSADLRDGDAELVGRAHARLYRIPQTALRLTSVYGPWDRPDSPCCTFADAIMAGRPVTLPVDGRTRIDLAWIDDIVAGILAALDRPPTGDDGNSHQREGPHRVVGLVGAEPVQPDRLIDLLEAAIGRKVERRYAEPRLGSDAEPARANRDEATTAALLGWRAATGIEEGVPRFAAWHREYHATR